MTHRRTRRAATEGVLQHNIRDLLRGRRQDRALPDGTALHEARHHELCFGCGRQNAFGLQLEVERRGETSAQGRFFVKQDHQGPAGDAHPGVIATALAEAMSLCAGTREAPTHFELDLQGLPPVGTFVELSARVHRRRRGRLEAVAHATGEEGRLASARAVFAV